MKLPLGRWLLAAALLGLFSSGAFLLTGHWGTAIKITNYLFFLIFFGVIYEIIFFKK